MVVTFIYIYLFIYLFIYLVSLSGCEYPFFVFFGGCASFRFVFVFFGNLTYKLVTIGALPTSLTAGRKGAGRENAAAIHRV